MHLIGHRFRVVGQLQLGGKVVDDIAFLAFIFHLDPVAQVLRDRHHLAALDGLKHVGHRAPRRVAVIRGDDELRPGRGGGHDGGKRRGNVAHLLPGDGMVDDARRLVLSRQQRLDEGKEHQKRQHEQQKHRHPVFQKHAQRASPIGIVGISRALRGGIVVRRGDKQRVHVRLGLFGGSLFDGAAEDVPCLGKVLRNSLNITGHLLSWQS